MSVHALPVQAVLAGALTDALAVVAGLEELPVEAVCDGELGEALVALTELESRVSSVRLALLAEADRRRVAEQTAATGTDAWAARLTGTDRAVLNGGIWLARLLRDRYHAVRDAFAAGAIDEAKARVIVAAAEKLPAGVPDEARRAAEEAVVAKAVSGMSARGLRVAARRMMEVVSLEAADEHERAQMEEERRRAEQETFLTLHDNGNGTYSGRFRIPELQARVLQTVLERLTAPRRQVPRSGDRWVEEPTAPPSGLPEVWGAAFVEVLDHLPQDGWGPFGATVAVHLDYQRLLDGLGSARLDTGVRVASEEARRLACDAGILPVVLGGRSEVLDLGRVRRLHSPAQRRALSAIHETCAAEDCERPFAWCEIHHPHSWADGGRTDLANALPLCGHHHRRAHDDRYTMRVLPNRKARFRWRT